MTRCGGHRAGQWGSLAALVAALVVLAVASFAYRPQVEDADLDDHHRNDGDGAGTHAAGHRRTASQMGGRGRTGTVAALLVGFVAATLTVGTSTSAFSKTVSNTGNTFAAASAFGCSAPGSTQTVTADADATVIQGFPTTNYGANKGIGVRSHASDNYRALVHFPLPTTPVRCIATSATLQLTVVQNGAAARTLQVYQAASAWTESGATWNNQPATAGVPATATSVPTAGQPMAWNVTEQVAALYGGTNTGLTIRDLVEGSTTLQDQLWNARENSVNKPQLTVTFGDTLSLEGEALLPAVSSTAPAIAQANCCGATWSAGQQVWFQGVKAGDSAVLRFDVPQTGRYQLSTVQTLAVDYGITAFSVDGTSVGSAFDAYRSTLSVTAPRPVASVSLAAGQHTLTLKVTGKNAAATGYYAGLDYLTLQLTG